MSESTFVIFSKTQSVSINVEHITADHDALYAYLKVPVNFIFRAEERTGFDILPINAELFFNQPHQSLAKTVAPWGTSNYRQEANSGFILKFDLSQPALHFIEKNRKGDLPLSIELNIHTLFHRLTGGAGTG